MRGAGGRGNTLSEMECFKCGQRGHLKVNCPRLWGRGGGYPQEADVAQQIALLSNAVAELKAGWAATKAPEPSPTSWVGAARSETAPGRGGGTATPWVGRAASPGGRGGANTATAAGETRPAAASGTTPSELAKGGGPTGRAAKYTTHPAAEYIRATAAAEELIAKIAAEKAAMFTKAGKFLWELVPKFLPVDRAMFACPAPRCTHASPDAKAIYEHLLRVHPEIKNRCPVEIPPLNGEGIMMVEKACVPVAVGNALAHIMASGGVELTPTHNHAFRAKTVGSTTAMLAALGFTAPGALPTGVAPATAAFIGQSYALTTAFDTAQGTVTECPVCNRRLAGNTAPVPGPLAILRHIPREGAQENPTQAEINTHCHVQLNAPGVFCSGNPEQNRAHPAAQCINITARAFNTMAVLIVAASRGKLEGFSEAPKNIILPTQNGSQEFEPVAVICAETPQHVVTFVPLENTDPGGEGDKKWWRMDGANCKVVPEGAGGMDPRKIHAVFYRITPEEPESEGEEEGEYPDEADETPGASGANGGAQTGAGRGPTRPTTEQPRGYQTGPGDVGEVFGQAEDDGEDGGGPQAPQQTGETQAAAAGEGWQNFSHSVIATVPRSGVSCPVGGCETRVDGPRVNETMRQHLATHHRNSERAMIPNEALIQRGLVRCEMCCAVFSASKQARNGHRAGCGGGGQGVLAGRGAVQLDGGAGFLALGGAGGGGRQDAGGRGGTSPSGTMAAIRAKGGAGAGAGARGGPQNGDRDERGDLTSAGAFRVTIP